MHCHLCNKDLTEEFHWRSWIRLVDGSTRAEQLKFLTTPANWDKPLSLVPICKDCGGFELWIQTLEGVG